MALGKEGEGGGTHFGLPFVTTPRRLRWSVASTLWSTRSCGLVLACFGVAASVVNPGSDLLCIHEDKVFGFVVPLVL